MTQKEFIEILEKNGYSYKFEEDILVVTHEGSVDLDNLTSLPENTTFKNLGYVFLRNITSVSGSTCFKNQGDVFFR